MDVLYKEEVTSLVSVCRLCLNLTEFPHPISYSNTLLKDVLPNLDLTLTKDPVLCSNCKNAITTSFNFKHMCMEQRKIRNYYDQSKGSVNLYELVKSAKSCDTVSNVPELELPEDITFFNEFCCNAPNNSRKNDSESVQKPQKQLMIILEDINQKAFNTKLEERNARETIKVSNPAKLGTPNRSRKKNQSSLYKKINPNLFSCMLCKRTFTQKLHVAGHLLTKHKDIPNIEKRVKSKIHYCQYCPYRTINNYNLAKHLISKHNQNNSLYQCKIQKLFCAHCKYSTANRGNLILHVRTHNLVRAFQCPLCEKSYNQKTGLDTHILTHANKVKTKCRFKQ